MVTGGARCGRSLPSAEPRHGWRFPCRRRGHPATTRGKPFGKPVSSLFQAGFQPRKTTFFQPLASPESRNESRLRKS
jgi:hypothetical protein